MSEKEFNLDDKSIADDVGDTVERMPEISDHFTPPNQEQQSESSATTSPSNVGTPSVDVDSAGIAYDPSIHSATKSKNARGEWRKKRRSKVSTGEATQSSSNSTTGNSLAPPTAEQLAAAKAKAMMYAEGIFMMGKAVGGQEWKPSDDEIGTMRNAWEQYFIAKRQFDVRPELMPTVAIIAYATPRFTLPETKTRLGRFRTWIDARVANWRERRAKKTAIKNPNAPKPEEKE